MSVAATSTTRIAREHRMGENSPRARTSRNRRGTTVVPRVGGGFGIGGDDSRTVTSALKEWAAMVAAIRSGAQCVLVRKGGVEDGGFDIRDDAFAFFPTNWHANETDVSEKEASRFARARAGSMKDGESVSLSVVARVTGAWTVDGSKGRELLSALEARHWCWSADVCEKRVKWNASQPLTVVEVRAYEASNPTSLRPDTERFGGCKSWVDIDPWTPKVWPCLNDAEFAEMSTKLRDDLKALGAVDLR